MKRKGILILMAITLVMSACKKKGCTDPTAINYSASAEKDDGSCEYQEQPTSPTTLDCQEFNNAGTTYELEDLGLAVDYIVDCCMTVSCDLIIKPGVTIAFATDACLKVNSSGSLKAIATTTGTISFTGVDKFSGAWGGLYFNSDDVKNEIDGCLVEYGGSASYSGHHGGILIWASSKLKVKNSIIKNNEGSGINANLTGSEFTFTNNTISGCDYPMFVSAEYVGSISGGTFTGNTTDVIYIDTYAADGYVQTNQTWTNLNVPYRYKGGGEAGTYADWSISPGVVIEFEPSVLLKITDGNSLNAVGTPTEMIQFRGATSGAGAWKNIKFWGTNVLNEIAFAEISGGGEDPTNTKGSVYLWYDAKLNIHDVTFNDNAACGVYGKISSGTTANPNYSSSNLMFNNTPCTETFEN